jgi:hypothetical protein
MTLARISGPKNSARFPLKKHLAIDLEGCLGAHVRRLEAIATIDPLVDEDFAWAVAAVSQAGLAQEALAAKLDVAPSTISRWSRGARGHLPPNQHNRRDFFSLIKQAYQEYIDDIRNGRRQPTLPKITPAPERPASKGKASCSKSGASSGP